MKLYLKQYIKILNIIYLVSFALKSLINKKICINNISNFLVKTIEERWNDLLKRFRNEKAKLKEKPMSGSGAASVTATWVLYEDMLFLDEPTLKHRQVVSSMMPKEK